MLTRNKLSIYVYVFHVVVPVHIVRWIPLYVPIVHSHNDRISDQIVSIEVNVTQKGGDLVDLVALIKRGISNYKTPLIMFHDPQ